MLKCICIHVELWGVGHVLEELKFQTNSPHFSTYNFNALGSMPHAILSSVVAKNASAHEKAKYVYVVEIFCKHAHVQAPNHVPSEPYKESTGNTSLLGEEPC